MKKYEPQKAENKKHTATFHGTLLGDLSTFSLLSDARVCTTSTNGCQEFFRPCEEVCSFHFLGNCNSLAFHSASLSVSLKPFRVALQSSCTILRASRFVAASNGPEMSSTSAAGRGEGVIYSSRARFCYGVMAFLQNSCARASTQVCFKYFYADA